jgi:hypothetical protein
MPSAGRLTVPISAGRNTSSRSWKSDAPQWNSNFFGSHRAGVFVELIRAMQNWPKKVELEQAESRKEKFAHALRQLQIISHGYEGMEFELKVDDTIIKDRFILLAMMNTELIGPKLHLAPEANRT